VKQFSQKTQGFSLIEMMTVVAILAILSTLLIVGISKLQTNAKRQQTAQLLENCRAMWAEYDSVNRLHVDPFVMGAPGNVTLESEIATEQQTGNGLGDRIGTDVFFTRAVFALMRSQPGIKAEMDKFPSGRMFLTSQAASAQFQGNVSYQWGFNPPAYSAQTASISPGYLPGSMASYSDPVTQNTYAYLCIHAPISGVVPSPPDKGYWIPVNSMINGNAVVDTSDPVLLDAWGNPIICCIGGQLGTGQQIAADGTVPPGALVVGAKWANGYSATTGAPAKVSNPGTARSIIVSAPDHRPFWASAGPDGDFSRGDDNIYSFEK
jgi:prepilin-type N-terminal cleavage/methylation domain-containing protein